MITSAASDEKRISKFLEGAIDLVLWLLHPFENYENQSLPTGESATSFSAPSFSRLLDTRTKYKEKEHPRPFGGSAGMGMCGNADMYIKGEGEKGS